MLNYDTHTIALVLCVYIQLMCIIRLSSYIFSALSSFIVYGDSLRVHFNFFVLDGWFSGGFVMLVGVCLDTRSMLCGVFDSEIGRLTNEQKSEITGTRHGVTDRERDDATTQERVVSP